MSNNVTYEAKQFNLSGLKGISDQKQFNLLSVSGGMRLKNEQRNKGSKEKLRYSAPSS